MSFSFCSGAKRRPFRLGLLATAIAGLFQSGLAWAVDPFVLKDIRVEGLQRTDPGTVFASLPFRIGDIYNDEKGAAALRALFATGLFKDVRIQIDGSVVVVVVEERPVISKVEFTGTKEFDKDVLVKALKDIGIGEGQPAGTGLQQVTGTGGTGGTDVAGLHLQHVHGMLDRHRVRTIAAIVQHHRHTDWFAQ